MMCSIAVSQGAWPRTLVIGNDTIVGITRAQRNEVLKAYNYIDFLKKEIDILQTADSANAKRIAELQKAVTQYEAIIANLKAAIAELNKANKAGEEQLLALYRFNRRTKAKLIGVSIGATGGAAAVGFIAGYLVKDKQGD